MPSLSAFLRSGSALARCAKPMRAEFSPTHLLILTSEDRRSEACLPKQSPTGRSVLKAARRAACLQKRGYELALYEVCVALSLADDGPPISSHEDLGGGGGRGCVFGAPRTRRSPR